MLNKFLEWQKSNGLKDSTITNYRMYLNPMNEFKPLDQWANGDAIKYILQLQKTSKPSTVEAAKIIMKVFFKWLQKPEVVANIKIKNIKNGLKREDILTVDDTEKMIESTPSPLYKALIAFLFESGARINEVLAIKVKDIQDTNIGMTISIPQTKTGEDYRPFLASLSCAAHIRNHLTYSDLQPNDILFNLSNVAAWRQLKRIGKNAGITKKVNPHAFRHAHATDMVLRGYQESIIKMQLGWAADSRMIGRYQHINNNDVINAMAKMAGTDITKAPIIKNLPLPKSLEIANASLKIKKLEDENQELKKEIKETKESSTDASLQLKKLSEEFEKLKLSLLGSAAILGAIQEGALKPEDIKKITEMEPVPDKDNPHVRILFDESFDLSKAMDQSTNKKKKSK